MEAAAVLSKLRDIAQRNAREGRGLVTLLQEMQAEYSYLPEEGLRAAAEALKVPLSQVYSVATFYHSFSLEPRGKHTCLVCLGTACHVRGGVRIAEEISRVLGVKSGETTSDGLVTYEAVNCLGACALAPLVVVDGEYHARMTPRGVNRLLKRLAEEDAAS